MNRQELIDKIILTCTKTKAKDEAGQIEKAALSLLVTREELIKGQILRHIHLIERAERRKSKARHALTLSFQGIDSRRLIEYKEIRAYFQSILLCLLEIDTGSMGDLFARHQKGRAEFTFYGADIVAHIRKHIEKAVRYANGLKESEAAQREFIGFVLDAISYERLIEDAEAI